MDLLDRVRIGDLRALALIRDGLSMESTSVILKTNGPCIRNRMKRLEAATGKRLYVHRKTPTNAGARLTAEGYVLAEYADKVIELMEVVSRRP